MLFLIISAVGLSGAAIFGALGLSKGHGSELEQILAVAFLAIAAAGAVGKLVSRSERESAVGRAWRWPEPRQLVMAVVAGPLVLMMIGVFVLTLIPSMFVMLPLIIGWSYGAMGDDPEPDLSLVPGYPVPGYG